MPERTYTVVESTTDAIILQRRMRSLRKIKLVVGNTPGRIILTFSYPIPVMSQTQPDQIQLFELPTYTIEVSGIDDRGNSAYRTFEVYRFGIYNNDGSDTHYTKRGLFVAGLADDQKYTIDRFDPGYSVHSATSVEKGAWHVKDGFLIHDGPDTPMTAHNYLVEGLYASIGCIEVCGGPAGFDRFNEFIISLSGTKKAGTEALQEIGAAKIIDIHYLPASRPSWKIHKP